MSLFAPLLGFIWKQASEFGLDAEALMREAEIDPALRLDINARITEKQFDDLVWLARRESHDEAFIFHLIHSMHPSYLGALGFSWITSSSLRKAFERAQRYYRLVTTRTQVHLEEEGGELMVRFDDSGDNYRDPALRERLRLAAPVQLCRLSYGQSFAPSRAYFRHPAPGNTRDYYEFFRCELSFDQPATCFYLPLELADEPLPGFNPQIVEQFDRLIVDYLAKHDRKDILGRTRAALLEELPSGEVSLERTAEMLTMTPRTLTRRLQEKGHTFKSLLQEIRRELAEKYILDKGLTLTEISFLLGFSEASSFSRAYRGWTGHSPSAHRETLLTE
jgi:AraC-like DNA-binding protein